jgi:serine/threonine protein kinase
MVDEREGLKVLDFGLAKFTPTEGESVDISEVLTQENVAMGTLPYMSPEQVQGSQLDHRSDIFSMGVVLYEMATGKRPFRAKHPAQIITSIMNDHPPPVDLLNPTYPAGVARAISRCMEKETDARFGSATEVLKILSYS